MLPSSSTRSVVGELYIQHHSWVVQLLRRKLGNREQALEPSLLLRSLRSMSLFEPANAQLLDQDVVEQAMLLMVTLQSGVCSEAEHQPGLA